MNRLAKFSFLLALLASAGAIAQPAMYVEGTHYVTLEDPVRTSDPNKIEVAEVFWYGCGHCYAFEPLIESWEAKLPADVEFVRSPVIWDRATETHARVFYTAETLGVVDKVHGKIFDEIHQRRNNLLTEDAIRELFVANGVDGAEFDKAWKSFGTSSAVNKAKSRVTEYGVRGVPALIVNGKYRITGAADTTRADQLKIADFLVAKERGAN